MEIIWKDFPEKWDDNSSVSSLNLEIPSWPLTNNLFIEGDNYPVLKKLEKNFTEKINLIYIDPPYNTGNAFELYDDSIEHSIWLGLMRERLICLQQLLANDGCIWIQIDDEEQAYLKVLCDEIFGRNNFINMIAIF